MKRTVSTSSELNDFVETADGKKEYNVSKSRLMSFINWAHVLGIYLPSLWIVALLYLGYQIVPVFLNNPVLVQAITSLFSGSASTVNLSVPVASDIGWKLLATIAILVFYINRRQCNVFLVDFATFEPPEDWRISYKQTIDVMRMQPCFTEESVQFMERMLLQSGCGPRTAWPPGIMNCFNGAKLEQNPETARKEAELVIFDVVRNVLKKTNTKASAIDILIINCSLFSPTPSLCSMVINEFGLKPDISSYNLSGMGCAAGLISVELAKNMLQAKPGSLALIVSTEIITPNLYHGNDRSFLLQNMLFRCGGAAMLLSNKWVDGLRAKFKLLHVVRTQYVSEDSFGCVYETEDDKGNRGVRLSKDIVKVAGRALEKNFTMLGPYVLPFSEQFKVVVSMASRAIFKAFNLGKLNPYIPVFTTGIHHFCIHAGGRGVIDGIEKNLKLTPAHVAASRHALYTYGNTSSSSIWYEMDYIRNYTDLRRGHRVLQVAFGSGFKCNSAVWLCLSPGLNKPPPERKPAEDKKDD